MPGLNTRLMRRMDEQGCGPGIGHECECECIIHSIQCPNPERPKVIINWKLNAISDTPQFGYLTIFSISAHS